MPKKNNQPPSNEQPKKPSRERHFIVELYTEWENCADILCDITSNAQKYAYITHDKDVYTEEQEAKNPKHKAGTRKKTHIHLYVYLKNGATLSAFAKRYKIEQRFVEVCVNPKGSLRYLTHIDDPDKHQYDRSEVYSNFDMSYLYRTEKNEGECVLELLDFAMTATRRETIKYAVQQNIYDVLRRNWNIIFTTKDEETKVQFHKEQRIRFQSITRDEIGRIFDIDGREVIICKNGECYGEAIEKV